MGSFDGVAELYQKVRHGYPVELRDHLIAAGLLTAHSAVVDLGAGTGQLAALVAPVATTVVAVDPEPDMVQVGRQATAHLTNVSWLQGADSEVLDLFDAPADLVLIGNAFHHMNQVVLLKDLDAVLRPAGGVVVCSSSTPVWLQDNDWSRALREQLSVELGRPVGAGGAPDHSSDLSVLRGSPFADVEPWSFVRIQERRSASIIGEIVSSASGSIDTSAAERLAAILEPHLTGGAVAEQVNTTALVARRPAI